MSDELENFHRLHRKKYTEPLYPFKPVASMPSNTLKNADGTPYQANYDSDEQKIRGYALWLHKELLRNNYVNLHGEWSEEESTAFDEFLTVKIQNILVQNILVRMSSQ